MSKFDGFRVEINQEKRRGDIILSRPPLNIIQYSQRIQIAQSLRDLDKNEEIRIVKGNNFPFFYSPIQKYEEVNIGENIFVYVPINLQGCWAIKTPCIHTAQHVYGKKVGNYNVILKKNN